MGEMMAGSTAKPVEALSFEEALTELEGVVRALESGSAPLDQSIAAYERGVALHKRCEAALARARARVEAITLGEDGTPTTGPLDKDGGTQRH